MSPGDCQIFVTMLQTRVKLVRAGKEMSDGREEREEEERRREQERLRDLEDRVDRDLKDQWEPERDDS